MLDSFHTRTAYNVLHTSGAHSQMISAHVLCDYNAHAHTHQLWPTAHKVDNDADDADFTEDATRI